MFGHHDNRNDDTQNTTSSAPVVDNTILPSDGAVLDHDAPMPEPVNPALPDDATMFAPSMDDVTAPVETPEVNEAPAPAATDDLLPTDDQGHGDLLNIKQQALTELSPLVDHLNQSPEEKFRTTMMLIQASDNQALVPVAYQAAQSITDEKVKAQALLDIVNEINYFTSQNK